MKVLIYSEGKKQLSKSGIGKAATLQMKVLESAGITYTTDVKDKDIDLVHINTVFYKSYRLLKKFKKKGIPVISHGHSTFEDFENSFAFWKLVHPWFKRRLLKMYRNADAIITPTNYSKGLIENYPKVTSKVYALSNGLDVDSYKKNPEYIKRFKNHFNLTNEKIIISVGLFFQRKGLIDFMEIARKLPEYKFIWFGHLDKVLTSRTIKKAIKNKPDNVIMAGYHKNEIIKGAFQSADCVLFPSYEETEGIVVLEALAAKTPLIIRDIPVYADWLINDIDVLKGNNIDEFVELIESLELINTIQICDNGYNVIQQRSIEEIGKKTKTIYEEVIENKRKR